MDWFLYDNSLRHERVKIRISKMMDLGSNCLVLIVNPNLVVNTLKI